ncbi:protoglobin domain-containing protein [Sulfurimonas paralvinellae]|uniref:Globin-sensor domain-containing protein n=1 Tax=Sulfurimonas paralvinellae TaxID=317658 RepID=A0A7M1B8Q9_9BACT|nr:protoglobin domain-containing protein [Sulfurimonas paralvinellae]QOP45806.1 hypothetical protein FM071_05690 [Sulfurimonas paralvinellae]
MKNKIRLIQEIYDLDPKDLPKRKEAIEKIAKYVDEIMDKFYEELLTQPEFSVFIPVNKIDLLKKKQIAFIISLLSEPFDETLYEKIAKVGIVHYHIRLDPVHMSYGYHLLSKLILAQAARDVSLMSDLKLVIKYLKVAETIMVEEYFEQKNIENSPYRANNLSLAMNEFNAAYMHCSKNIDALIEGKSDEININAKEKFERHLQKIDPYRDILKAVGLDIATVKRYCTLIENAQEGEKRQKEALTLKNYIKRSLNDLQITSFLSLNSSLNVIRSITDVIYNRTIRDNQKTDEKIVKQNITKLLQENFAWAIEKMLISDDKPETSSYDIVKHIMLPGDEEKIIYVGVSVKEISNRIYVLESVDLLCEIIKMTIFLYNK